MAEPALWPMALGKMGGLEVLMSREISHGPFCQREPFLPSQVLGSINQRNVLSHQPYPSLESCNYLVFPIYIQMKVCSPSRRVVSGREWSLDPGCDPQFTLLILILCEKFTFHQYQHLGFPGGRKGPKRRKRGRLNQGQLVWKIVQVAGPLFFLQELEMQEEAVCIICRLANRPGLRVEFPANQSASL